jgi:hypothetical protein
MPAVRRVSVGPLTSSHDRRKAWTRQRLLSLAIGIARVLTAATAGAQGPPAYGPGITLEQAKKVMAGAEAKVKKNNWPVVITILDSGGNLVMARK